MRRSGELLPFFMLPSGTREGILEGETVPAAEATEFAKGLRLMVPVGVLAPARDGAARITLPARELDTAGLETFIAGAGPEGVFDLGGRDFAAVAANSSRYLSP